MSSLYNSLFTDVFRRPPAAAQAPLQLGSGRSPPRTAASTAYDEATLGLSAFAASLGPGGIASPTPNTGLSSVDKLRAEYDVPRRTSPQRSPFVTSTRVEPTAAATPSAATQQRRPRSPVAAGRAATSPTYARLASPPHPHTAAAAGNSRGQPYVAPSPLRSGSPQGGGGAAAHSPGYGGGGARAPKRGAVAAEARPLAPAVVDSFGRVPYVVPGTAVASGGGGGGHDTSADESGGYGSEATGTGYGGDRPSARQAPVSQTARVTTPRPKVGSSLSDYERERIRMRNRTVPNRQPVKPRVTNTKIRGDFGLPSELPPARPRIDAATYELREGLHSVAEEMRVLNERLAQLTETHWGLQQESERLRRDIQDAEAERSQAKQKFEDMCASVKESVAELESELARRDAELAQAREENERLRRGVQAVSEAAKDRRIFVDRAMARAQLEATVNQPPRIYNGTSNYVPIGSMAPSGYNQPPPSLNQPPRHYGSNQPTAGAAIGSAAIGGNRYVDAYNNSSGGGGGGGRAAY